MSSLHETGVSASLSHVLGRLSVVEERVRAMVGGRKPASGVFLSQERIDQILDGPRLGPGSEVGADLLAAVEQRADAAAAAGEVLRLRKLQRTFGLSDLDVEVLLVALAPDVDVRFESVFAYLSDDITCRRATVGLALELAGESAASAEARHRLRPGSPLVDGGLVALGDVDRPVLSRPLAVPDRVVMHLLGDDRADPIVARREVWAPPCFAGDPEALAAVVARGARLCYLQESGGAPGRALAVAAAERVGVPVVSLRLDGPGGEHADPVELARAALREARLRGGCLVAGPADQLAAASPDAMRELADAEWPTLLIGTRSWSPAWARTVPLVVEVPAPTLEARGGLWRSLLNGDCEPELDPAAETITFRLGPDQIDRAAAAAWLQATYQGRKISGDDLRRGARAQNSAALEQLGRRVDAKARWDDLILPAPVKTRLRELLAQARWREQVLDVWGLGRTGRGGRGITALFAGPSGTGKTLAAEVIAHELGVDLYTVDLSTLVDKYVGETEKNLDRVFEEAERINGVLFFDEADALFGKRSEVRDAHDRYANLEVAYLLQRLELFDGIAMLATNMRNNIDEAFMRRLDAVLHFPLPDEDDRHRLWQRFLGTGVPVDDDLDLAACARTFELAGGSIRNVCLAAAYYAADRGTSLGMTDIILGVQREYEKLGLLLSPEEIDPFAEMFERA
jgi:hypothetical protein